MLTYTKQMYIYNQILLYVIVLLYLWWNPFVERSPYAKRAHFVGPNICDKSENYDTDLLGYFRNLDIMCLLLSCMINLIFKRTLS